MKQPLLSLALILTAGLTSWPFCPAAAKSAGAAFYTETFASLPAGWTATARPGSVNGWRRVISAPTGTGNLFPVAGLIQSRTPGDGWLLYNADSVINTSGPGRPIGGAITSAAIPVGASHTSVMLRFVQNFRYSEGDSCFVDVSADGATWTSFPVNHTAGLTQFGSLYSKGTVTTLNISSVVGGQASAYIRFRFASSAAQYSFDWLIDDLTLYDADATDLGISYSGIATASRREAGFTTNHSYSSIPLSLADTVFPITYLSNYGLGAAPGTTLTASYYMGGNLLSTKTATTSAMPLGARDSAVVFSAGYKPTAAGDYIVALRISPAGDGDAGNNADTIRFSVTDSVYAPYGRELAERNSFLNRPSTSTLQYWGSRFAISNGARDTLTSVSAAFRPETAPGERVMAQLYRASGSGTAFDWIPLALTATRTLSAADISTPGNIVMTTFPFRVPGSSFGALILDDGDYAVVLTTVHATKDVAVYAMESPLPIAPSFIGYQGQSGTSLNDANYNFAVGGGIATGLVQVPLVRPNFGNPRALLTVIDAGPILLGAAFPNPAHTSVRTPVLLQEAASAGIVLCNAQGQVVDRIDLGRMAAGAMQVAEVRTGHLPDGVYFYQLSAGAHRAGGSMVVKH